jgi:hypothetical protein
MISRKMFSLIPKSLIMNKMSESTERGAITLTASVIVKPVSSEQFLLKEAQQPGLGSEFLYKLFLEAVSFSSIPCWNFMII